ncbi:phage antirepressor protein [Candidatus Woesearchaeota archaeon CG10_big_fil_rev_8_21_14_0_10_34_12]|nr:MAG: phage antirepressor protein [Candidatus Woesearchaeota archaeon CG10_big_fil_rev_8_21_14_0_10_34_12]
MEKDEIIVFRGKNIRRRVVNDKWFFSIIDVINVLTNSTIPKRYWSDLKIKLKEEGFESYDKIVQLKLKSIDGKEYGTDCADTEAIFRIIQSIPSKKAEPFKRWLAKVGYERIQEIENPELAQERMKNIYELKGYSKDWIDKRLRGGAIRQNLTDEWKNRGLKEEIEYAILTNEISKATFDKTIEEYKKLKGLDRENLRDHMDELELIFGMLGEKVTTEITINKNAEGFQECAIAAKQGGEVAGNARKEAEYKIGRPVVSEENYLFLDEKSKKKRKKKVLEVKNEK